MFEHLRNFDGFIVKRNQILLESDRDMPMEEKLIKARIKVNKALLWVNINRGFFGRLLGNLNIYGSSAIDPPTMCTNGLNIVYHPDFVLTQTDAAIRFVLCHEVLHCVGDHMTRRGNRDPLLWNYAADYAINPILHDEIDRNFAWPIVPESGERMGLFEQKYAGMRAEDIYDDLIKDLQKNSSKAKEWEQSGKDFGKVIDSTEDLPGPDNEESIVQDVTGEAEENIGKGTGQDKPGEPKTPGQGQGQGQGKPGDQPGEGDRGNSNIVGKKVTITSGPNKGKTGIVKRVLPNGDIEIE